MKLDDLISKYLDGELSYNDDVLLRQMLKDNPDAKADFDAAVLINATIREDASTIKAPSELIANTEDLVLMRILNEADRKAHSKEKRRIIAWLPRLSFVFTIFILIAVYFITDMSNPFVEKTAQFDASNSKKLNISEQIAIQSNNANKVNLSKSQNQSQKKFLISSKGTFTKNTITASSEIALSQSSTETHTKIDNEIPLELNSSEPIAFNNNYNNIYNLYSNDLLSFSPAIPNISMFSNTVIRSNLYYDSKLKPILNLPMFDNFNTPVVLNTLFSTSSYKNKSFATLSQSVGYNFDKNISLGLEFGYTSYNYDQTTTIKVPTSSGGVLSSKVEIGNSSEQTADYINLPINLEQRYRQYWISTFVDYNIFDYDAINLSSRFGAGLSGNGALAYTRLLAELELYNGIYLKFGGELKTFEALMHNAKSKYITTGALLYGLQLKLY